MTSLGKVKPNKKVNDFSIYMTWLGKVKLNKKVNDFSIYMTWLGGETKSKDKKVNDSNVCKLRYLDI